MAFNMTFPEVCAALELRDDNYAAEKYDAVRRMGRAMNSLSDAMLERLVDAYMEAHRV